MTEPIPKSPETLRAQTAAFLSAVEYFRLGDQLLNNVGKIAAGPLENLSLVIEKDHLLKPKSGWQVRVSDGIGLHIASPEDYVRFLREKGGARHEDIQGRVELLEAYGQFAPDISKLKSELEKLGKRANSHPNFLGSGTTSRAYTIYHKDQEYVAIIPRFSNRIGITINSRIEGALRARGLPHMEQMVAASYDEGVTISERLPGLAWNTLAKTGGASITDEQLAQLLVTLETALQHGVGIDFDADGTNFLYDPKEGFGVVDVHASDAIYLGYSIKKTASSLGIIGLDVRNRFQSIASA